MNINIDWQYFISNSWRIFFINIVSVFHMLWINHKFLPLKHSPTLYVLFFAVRAAVIYIGFQVVLSYFYENSSWYHTAFNSVSIFFIIAMFFVLYYTFEGEFLKIFLSSCLTEIVTIFPFNLSLAFINYLDGREDLFYMYGEFQLWDLLFPVLLFPVTLLMGIIVFPYIQRFRNWEIKYRKLLWCIFLAYGVSAISTYLIDRKNYFWQCLLSTIIYIVLVIGFAVILRYNQQKIQAEKNYYHTRQRLIASYLPDILKQLKQMEDCRKIIDTQMKEIIHLESTQANNNKIRSYLTEIQQAYGHIKAGIYCENWLVDSALCYEQKIMEKEGIPFSCHIQSGQADFLPSEDMVLLLLFLMDWGIENMRRLPDEENKQIRLQIYSVKNHLLLQLDISGKKKFKLRQKPIQNCLKKYSGSIHQEEINGYYKTVIDLQYNMIHKKGIFTQLRQYMKHLQIISRN